MNVTMEEEEEKSRVGGTMVKEERFETGTVYSGQ